MVATSLARSGGGAGRPRLVVIDFRRGLADLAGLGLPFRLVSRPPQVEEVLAEFREETVERLRALDRGETSNGDGNGHRSGEEIYVLVDDYDLVSAMPMNSLTGLADLIFQGRDAGVHVVLMRTAAGAARGMLDPVMSRLVESGAPAVLLSGDPHEGALVRGVRAEPLPPGRGRLLRRRGRPALVQLAYVEAIESPVQKHAAGSQAGRVTSTTTTQRARREASWQSSR